MAKPAKLATTTFATATTAPDAIAAAAATTAVEAMVAETHRSMAAGDLAIARRAVVAAMAAYRSAVDKARPDPRTARLDLVLATGAELETAMAKLAAAKAKAASAAAAASVAAARWEETDLELIRAVDALLADD